MGHSAADGTTGRLQPLALGLAHLRAGAAREAATQQSELRPLRRDEFAAAPARPNWDNATIAIQKTVAVTSTP
jgi:hypothetical protein